MAIIGLVPLILISIVCISYISITQIPSHQSTTLALSVFLSAVLATNFTRSGNVEPKAGASRGLGDGSLLWLSTAYLDDLTAYDPHFIKPRILPSINYPRLYGFSLRCLSSLPRPSGRGRRRLIVCHRSGF